MKTWRTAKKTQAGAHWTTDEKDGQQDDGRGSRAGGRSSGGPDVAETALPVLVFEDGLEEVRRPEIGPEDRRDPDLGVGDLPEQEVRDPHLAARPDEQVGIGQAGGVEMARRTRPRRRPRA